MRTLLKLIALVVVLGVVVIGSVLWGRLNEPFKGYAEAERFVEIPPGTPVTGIGRRLVEAGVVRDPLIFRVALLRRGVAKQLQAGEYRFTEPLAVAEVVDRLVRGDVYTQRITFPEGLTIVEMATLYESRGIGRAADFLRAAKDPQPVADLDPKASDLEGYLFPETYVVTRGMSAAALVRSMVDRFKIVFNDDLRQRAREESLTIREAVTLAGLVEKETGHEDERPVVAAVYRNRMRIGMPMQADPTLIYALAKAGRYDGNIRRVDMGFDSPYNTYKYPGLPPGPIASPGKASLTAALSPASVDYLYFVSRNDGTHAFAATLAEHNQNVQKYQVQYFRDRRQQ